MWRVWRKLFFWHRTLNPDLTWKSYVHKNPNSVSPNQVWAKNQPHKWSCLLVQCIFCFNPPSIQPLWSYTNFATPSGWQLGQDRHVDVAIVPDPSSRMGLCSRKENWKFCSSILGLVAREKADQTFVCAPCPIFLESDLFASRVVPLLRQCCIFFRPSLIPLSWRHPKACKFQILWLRSSLQIIWKDKVGIKDCNTVLEAMIVSFTNMMSFA
jgi:hypothetical protein